MLIQRIDKQNSNCLFLKTLLIHLINVLTLLYSFSISPHPGILTMEAGVPGKYSQRGETDRRTSRGMKITHPTSLEHHEQRHINRIQLNNENEHNRRFRGNLYKFGCIISICVVFILVIVLSALLSSEGNSSGAEQMTENMKRKFWCTDNLNGVNVTFILEFINEPSLEELNVDFLKTLLQTTIPRINVESVQVEEIKQPIIPVPTPESNSTEPTINTNTTIPSTTNQTTPSVITLFDLVPFCTDFGWQKTCYPNHLGYRNKYEVLASLSFFQQCHKHVQIFACLLLQPPCKENTGIVSVCRPFCEEVVSACSKSLEMTEIGEKNLCSDVISNYGPNCMQFCDKDDFICEQTRLCINATRRCDGNLDCGANDISDELNCETKEELTIVECKSNEFRCRNGLCISQSKTCNNENDCGDWEDEKNCTCRENWKKCTETGQCFPASFWCDGEFHCGDKSDELQCECPREQFICQNGACMPKNVRCNGVNDCGDFSDEFDCECQAEQFRCDKYLCKYFDNDWCNGKADCVDGTDEPANCTCKPGQFKCDDGFCLAKHRVCDRYIDCKDGSDELHCGLEKKIFAKKTNIQLNQLHISNLDCTPEEFQCEPGICIPVEKVCDGEANCANRKDELQQCECNSKEQFRCKNGQCMNINRYCNHRTDCLDGDDEFQNCEGKCPPGYGKKCNLRTTGEYKCLPESMMCDGVSDCERNEDEENCKCREDQFQCNDGACKPWSLYCNSIHDCLDFSDETNCTCNEKYQETCHDGWCYDKNHRCDGKAQCADLSDEYNCTCAEYLRKSNPEKLCDYVQDCADRTDELNCSYIPNNLKNKYDTFLCYGGAALDRSKICDGNIDCPMGDDEYHCYFLMPKEGYDLNKPWVFQDAGVIFVQSKGSWGIVCAPSNKNNNSLNALAEHVCKRNLFHSVDYISRVPLDNTQQIPTYQLNSFNPKDFVQTDCPSKQTIAVMCKSEICGQDPYKLSSPSVSLLQSTAMRTLPFFASIYTDGKHRCSGIIYQRRWILTSASCVEKNDLFTMRVRVGQQRNSSLSPFDQFFYVAQAIKHSMYKPIPNVEHDIALLQLDKNIQYTPFVQPICLGNGKVDVSKLDTHTIGMGRLRRKAIKAEHADLTRLSVKNADICKSNLIVRLERVKIAENQFCTLERDKSYLCQGETGSPILTQYSNGTWAVVGLTTDVNYCFKKKFPTIFTDLSHYSEWIQYITDYASKQKERKIVHCEGSFSCLLGNCIESASVCDGIRDCAFGEDEICSYP
ncbi:Low-density lipoprotein receptor-related protein 1B [Trichinella sp. T6]|nr:Low-density lipoprotein receptor-related protein 1B [Trichinella sp. T6]